jgi:D-mannonate dehydratase
VHFRNVRTIVPKYKYVEVFIDEGENDMLAAMRALHGVGYSHMLVQTTVRGFGATTTNSAPGAMPSVTSRL